MDQQMKQEIVAIIRAETVRFATREEMRADMRQIIGVFVEHMDEKFKLVMEALDIIFRKLDERDRMFADVYARLDRKADVDEIDGLERRVIRMEKRGI